MNLYIFYGLSTLMIFSSLMVLISKKPIHSLLYLIFSFFTLAGHYIMLNAQFLAVVHIIVYAGAIMVLFLFVLMLLRPENEKKFLELNPKIKIFAMIVAFVVFAQLAYIIFFAKPSQNISKDLAKSVDAGTIEAIGRELFTNYIVPFEAAGFLLLAATIGALVLAKKKFE